ncbi:hypothetical protein CHRY9390_00401 [Chryseobacterium aquaeductus]|uniref:Uncharacterized protein n=1 Tax=Chryseobacterium aquaeductus TaxID=2675056 RepID=A0A9N8QTA7_9FLAO|nr:hypothetical protein [Chryseobacterium aquaeductus]CAA7329758.1 hypothetical protein CHRY9390_00401 [Chryseobacterium potabilaquae]CAD7798876.1 hypothetical protein CHRY9390_00401 [Chryseobacterium aquaeductus]
MKNLFLTLKSWQLFLLIFLIPFIIGVVSINYLFNSLHYHYWMKSIFGLLLFLEIGDLLWKHSIVFGLGKQISTEFQVKKNSFYIFFILRFLSLFVFLKLINYLAYCSYTDGVKFPIGDALGTIIVVLGGSFLFSFLAQIGIVVLTAKTLKTIETQRKITFSDYIGNAFLFYFSPIGIFILQPQINNLISDDL